MEAEPVRKNVQIQQLRSYLDEELSYPIDQESVVDRIGSIEIEGPHRQDSETLATIVDSLGRETYDSADELYNTIIGNLNEEHIGRKYYDDRGQQSAHDSAESEDQHDVSF